MVAMLLEKENFKEKWNHGTVVNSPGFLKKSKKIGRIRKLGVYYEINFR